jgi:mRNA interferase MazF
MAIGLIRRGDILLTNFSPARSGEPDDIRPAVVISNNVANANAAVLVVVPITSNLSRVYPFELLLPNNRTGLDLNSKAQANLLRAVNINRFIKPLGYVPEDLMGQLDERIREHLAL